MHWYGSLVKRLRRRPLTAETAVRFRYELFKNLVASADIDAPRFFFLCVIVLFPFTLFVRLRSFYIILFLFYQMLNKLLKP